MLREAFARCDIDTVFDLSLVLVRETENLRTWARANGLNPPHFEVTAYEAEALDATIIPLEVAVTRARIYAAGPELDEPVAQASR